MILCPLQNEGVLTGSTWLQRRPVITQEFAMRPDVYKQFGMRGHNGLDFRCKEGTPIFAPCEGVVRVLNTGNAGYGLHLQIDKANLRIILGHLSQVFVKDGDHINMGDLIAKSGNTGFSTAPHLHMTMKIMQNGVVLNSDNGYGGAINFKNYVVTWKGTLLSTNL